MPQKHSRPVPGGRAFWWTETLWAAAAGLPVVTVALGDLPELDVDCWFDGGPATIRQVAEHARRIAAADLAHPVVLAADGSLMDGGHRLAKAWLERRPSITAVRFEVDPLPDWVEPGA